MNSATDEFLTDGVGSSSLSRSRIYALLAMGFGYPDEECHTGFSEGDFVGEMSQELGKCSPELLDHFNEVIAPQLKLTCAHEVFETQFLSAFETDMPTPSASLNEGVHIFKSDRPSLLLELKGFYSNFGLQVDDVGNELADALTAELEFMQFLVLKQAQAEVQGTSSNAYKLAQKDFLERHLCAWLPLVRAEIAEKVTTQFFVALAVFAEKFALAHLHELKRELDT